MIDTRVVKNILIETLVNLDADVSFILSYTNLVKPIIINKWYYDILKKWSKLHKMTLKKRSKCHMITLKK